jgi:hypothetical protein
MTDYLKKNCNHKGFTKSCGYGHASNLMVKLYAIFKGLQLTWDLGYHRI